MLTNQPPPRQKTNYRVRTSKLLWTRFDKSNVGVRSAAQHSTLHRHRGSKESADSLFYSVRNLTETTTKISFFNFFLFFFKIQFYFTFVFARELVELLFISSLCDSDCIELCLDRNICKMRDVCSFIGEPFFFQHFF